MKKQSWKPYLFWILFTEGVGFLSGWLTREGVRLFNASAQQPPLSPPAILFPIVWGILYALMGTGAARIYLAPASNARSRALLVYLIQLASNFLWSLIFFNLQNYALAFFWLLILWGMILLMILSFWKVDRIAAPLQIPYLLWVSFAAYLTFGVWMLNR